MFKTRTADWCRALAYSSSSNGVLAEELARDSGKCLDDDAEDAGFEEDEDLLKELKGPESRRRFVEKWPVCAADIREHSSLS